MDLARGDLFKFKRGEGVLIFDRVSPVDDDDDYILVQPKSERCENVLIREESIRSCNERFDGVPIYGVWQTLNANKVLNEDGVYTVEGRRGSGGYAVVSNGVLEKAGRFTGNNLMMEVGADAANDAIQIDLSDLTLTAPSQSAVLPEVLGKRALAKQKRARTFGMIAVAASVAAVIGMDYWFGVLAQQRQEALDAVESERVITEARLLKAKQGLLPEGYKKSDFSNRISLLAEAVTRMEGPTTTGPVSFTSNQMVLEGARLRVPLSFEHRVNRGDGGRTVASWGVAPADIPMSGDG